MYLFNCDLERTKKAANRLLRSKEDIIGKEEINAVFRAIRFISEIDADYANKLVPGAGDYLQPFEVQALIRADMADHEAELLVANRKVDVDRLRYLIIPMTSMFKVNEASIVNLASEIYDLVREFADIRGHERKDRGLKKIIEAIKDFNLQINHLRLAAKYLPYCVKDDFSEIRLAFMKTAYQKELTSSTFEDLDHDLELLSACIDLTLLKQANGVSKVHVNDNSEKKFIVERAYILSGDFDGPKFVTTLNSTFAHFCSLLLELAAARRDESFAGAIASFARSPEKAQIDADEKRFRQYEKRTNEPEDNFYEARDSAGEIIDKAISNHKILKLCKPGTPAYGLCTIIINKLIQDADGVMNQYGPNLVLVSRISRRNLDVSRERHSEQFERLRSLDIELGQVRRQSDVS